jgi:tetratricopeptide (TPR) repeat protein
VAELPPGYREVPEEDRKKAQGFFGHGDTKAAVGQFDYAIDMYLGGLKLDPDCVEAHRKLREVSLKRKASGGKALGMLDAMKLKRSSKDERENLANAEKLLAFDPGNTDYMLTMAKSAAKAGYFDTVLWIGPNLLEAVVTSAKPDADKILAIKSIYYDIKQYKLANEAMQLALRIRPSDQNLLDEGKRLGALSTIQEANYDKMGSFRDSVKDMKGQLSLMNQDKEVNDKDILAEQVVEAEAELTAAPNEPGKLNKLVDLLVKTEIPANEERAIVLLQEWFDRTQQYRFRKAIGQIRIKQMNRQERIKRAAKESSPEAKQQHDDFRRKMLDFEMQEFGEWLKAYPTDNSIRFDIGKRQLLLHQYEEAIGSFQQARNDPKYRTEAQILLAQAFFDAEYLDEANETLASLIKDVQNREGARFMDMMYLRGRVLEKMGQTAEAIKHFSQVFQLNSAYRDVAARIKKLRTGAAATTTPPAGTNQ